MATLGNTGAIRGESSDPRKLHPFALQPPCAALRLRPVELHCPCVSLFPPFSSNNEPVLACSPRYAIPGLTEMELPAEEEAELELMMIGAGVIDGPVHPLLAPLYPRLRTVHAEVGIYARPDVSPLLG